MSFEIRPATRVGVRPLVGFYGRSGSGKTMSALLFARGLAGDKGRVVLVDTENGRGSIFADLIPGGYSVIDLDVPFTPNRYQEAIVTAEKAADVVVVDSLSQEWSGEGGVLDWAEAELQAMGGGDNNKMRSWIKPKTAHKLMVQRLVRCAVPLICCLRAEEKTHVTKAEGGQKGKVVTDDFSSPLFDPRFIFEMLLNFETVSRDGEGGFVIPRKITHPSIGALLPGRDQQITVAHGEALAKWCASPGKTPDAKPKDDLATIKQELWKLTKPKHGGDKAKFVQFLVDQALIDPATPVEELSAENLKAVLAATKKKLNP